MGRDVSSYNCPNFSSISLHICLYSLPDTEVYGPSSCRKRDSLLELYLEALQAHLRHSLESKNFYPSVSAVFLYYQNLWQPLQVHYIKPKAINMYTVVQSISTKNKKSFKKLMFAFTRLKRKYATNKLQMYISIVWGWFFYVSKNITICNDNPIVEIAPPPTHYLSFSLSPAK